MGVLPMEDVRAVAQSILLRKRESGSTVPQAAPRSRALVHLTARMLVVVICVTALAGCSDTTHIRLRPQTVSGRNFIELKANIPRPRPNTTRSHIISETANTENVAEPRSVAEQRSVAEPRSRPPIPLPAASLLSPQPQPSCEITDASADERQKLDYERQCYRHAEMIVRSRLQLLQGAVDKTISAVDRSERSEP